MQDRATWHRLERRARSSAPAIRSTSPSTATASSRCRRRAASATRATARCRSTPAGQLVTATATRCSATAGRSCSSRPTARSRSARTAPITVREGNSQADSQRGKLHSSASPIRSSCRRTATAPSTYAGDDAAGRRPRPPRSRRARSRNPTCARVVEMSRMIEITRSYTQIAAMLQQQSDLGQLGDRQARRRPELRRRLDHARAQHRRDRHDGHGAQRAGHRQQPRQHDAPPATSASGPNSRTCSTTTCSRVGTQTSAQGNILPVGIDLGSGVKTVGTPRLMTQGTLVQTERHARRRDPRRRLLQDPAARRHLRLYARRLVQDGRARAHRHRARQRGACRRSPSRQQHGR